MTQLSLPTDTPWTVAQLTRAAKRAVEGGLGALWIRGEISGLKAYASGHWYFTLRDTEAQVRCTMWRTYNAKVGKPPADGTAVFLYGKPTVYEDKGEFQFSAVEMLTTEALGPRQIAYEKVKAALQTDGLFDQARKRPLPELPRAIAVVTSLDGAALRDIITVTHDRWPGMRLLVIGARVQGVEAEGELVRALGLVNRLEGVDCCIVGRGGGSKEDLAAFDTESVCRAVAAVRVPVVSAVGHETDVSLCDLVADVRAATPSAAAELIVPDAGELLQQLAHQASRLAGGLVRRTRWAGERLGRTGDRMERALTTRLESSRHQLERLGVQLDALSPLRVLERGYAVPQTPEGRVLRRRKEFEPGADVRLRVVDGEVELRVEGAA
ncbi:MAG TPA: exodeoxyribonuclease VII large subunit [Gemmatimonadales bacterium]|nr:exodeoxyribonuclease VII large subunit [Gemmatimonadales bacterium]